MFCACASFIKVEAEFKGVLVVILRIYVDFIQCTFLNFNLFNN